MANSTTHYSYVAGEKSLTAQKADQKNKGALYSPKQTTVSNILAYSKALRIEKSARIDSFAVFVN